MATRPLFLGWRKIPTTRKKLYRWRWWHHLFQGERRCWIKCSEEIDSVVLHCIVTPFFWSSCFSFDKLDRDESTVCILDISWSYEGFFDPSIYSRPYTEQTSWQYSQVHSAASATQFYRPDEYSSPQDDDEPPLLEELGINFAHIFKKTKSVLNPFVATDASILDGVDLAAPRVFCLAFACSLLLLGKIDFGYVYGIVTIGSLGM